MNFEEEPRVIIKTEAGRHRNPTVIETERLRGCNWHLWKKGQKTYGSNIKSVFVSFNKIDNQVILQELSIENYDSWIPPEFEVEKKYVETKAVDINQTEAQKLKTEKINRLRYLYDEFVKIEEYKKLIDSGFRTKYAVGSGIYISVSSRNNPNLIFNILIESGYISYMEYSPKHKAEVRKYQLIRTGVMDMQDLIKSIDYIVDYSI